MDPKLGSQNHTSNECEDNGERIQGYQDLQDYVLQIRKCHHEADQQDYPREDCDEYCVIDA